MNFVLFLVQHKKVYTLTIGYFQNMDPGLEPEFLATSGCLLSIKIWWLSKLVAFAKICGILQTRIDQKGDHMKINFDYFQI